MNTLVPATDDLDHEFLKLLTTATPAAMAEFARIMQAEAQRIGLNLQEAGQ